MAFAGWDTRSLVEINAAVHNHPLVEQVVYALGNNPLLRGFPLFACLVGLWSSHDNARRSRIATGIMAAGFATFLSLLMQASLHTHLRPARDAGLHLYLADLPAMQEIHRPWSFPSDTQTLYAALACIVYLERRRQGLLCFLYSLVTAGLVRVALGWHFPSDILGGLVLGVAVVVAASRLRYVQERIEQFLNGAQRSHLRMAHVFVFFFLAEAYFLFPGVQGFLSECKQALFSLSAH